MIYEVSATGFTYQGCKKRVWIDDLTDKEEAFRLYLDYINKIKHKKILNRMDEWKVVIKESITCKEISIYGCAFLCKVR